jgi:hypothetical protein
MKCKAPYSALLISSFLFNLCQAQEPQPKFNIVVLEGEGVINDIKQRVNRAPLVEVRDDNNKPVAGASVVFFLPNQGPSGTFANGSKTLTLTTDSQGRASAAGIRPNNQTGKLEIHVSASYQGQTATAVITQSNVAGVGPSTGMSRGTKILIILAVVGGATAGGIAATRGGSSSSSSGPPALVITPGTPTVAGPK